MDIDFVIPWVDGNDPLWQAEKNRCQGEKKSDLTNCESRYRDWGLMKYWFRAIEKYTPWFRTVHFVTWGHFPEFLNLDNPRLHIVRHKDYIPEEYLPTFSSHVLELNLHRIDGLADHFVYFNDDTFIIREMRKTDFFQNGLPCTVGSEAAFDFYGEIGAWQHAAVNDLGIINAHFKKSEQVHKYRNKYINSKYHWRSNIRTFTSEKLYQNCFVGFPVLHAPAAYMKDTFFKVWDAEPEILKKTCMHPFRKNSDVNQWVMLWWQIAEGCFTPWKVDNRTYWAHPRDIESIEKDIMNQNRDMICINDPDQITDFEEISKRIIDSFEAILPDKSSFEK
ncbi:MAG: Stealth CR1 domain-containing protein [Lachnospiraceae bacterium]|nr:Stealth CR1 domain-containing protein [Lachnospiraceae bacterium]